MVAIEPDAPHDAGMRVGGWLPDRCAGGAEPPDPHRLDPSELPWAVPDRARAGSSGELPRPVVVSRASLRLLRVAVGVAVTGAVVGLVILLAVLG